MGVQATVGGGELELHSLHHAVQVRKSMIRKVRLGHETVLLIRVSGGNVFKGLRKTANDDSQMAVLIRIIDFCWFTFDKSMLGVSIHV